MRPIDTMRPCRTPTSARKPGRPEPSITVPFLITRSYGMRASLPAAGASGTGRIVPHASAYCAVIAEPVDARDLSDGRSTASMPSDREDSSRAQLALTAAPTPLVLGGYR